MSADTTRTIEKVEAGAAFLQTQPVFDLATFSQWLAELRRTDAREVAVIAGVLILRSGEQAERLAKVPGVALGPQGVGRMKKAADREAEGGALAVGVGRGLQGLPRVRGGRAFAVAWAQAG